MTTTTTKLKGTLHLGPVGSGGVDAEAQVSAIGTPQTVTRDAPQTVLTGDVVQAAATYSYNLVGTMILDWVDPAGVFYWVQNHKGTVQPFTFTPVGSGGPTIAGSLILDGWNLEELNAGAMVLSKFTWPCQGAVTITPPNTATGATSGTPGTWTPANSVAPMNLAHMTGVTASPTTAWTTGQYVVLGDASEAHWSGTAWVAGRA